MTKQEFLNRLEQLLEGLPVEDKEDALNFYREYLEDAGPENEQAALTGLGDVNELAKEILAACQSSQPQAEPTKPSLSEPHRWPAPVQYVRPSSNAYQRQSQTPPKTEQAQQAEAAPVILREEKKHSLLATIIVIFFIITIGGPVFLGLFGTVMGLFVAAAVMVFVGILVGVIGLFSVASIGMSGWVIFGVCLIIAGFGLMALAGLAWLVSAVLKPVFRFARTFVRNFIHTKSEE